MDLLVAQLLNGLVYGVLLFLMAAGLSLIFGLMNVVSLAHGRSSLLAPMSACRSSSRRQFLARAPPRAHPRRRGRPSRSNGCSWARSIAAATWISAAHVRIHFVFLDLVQDGLGPIGATASGAGSPAGNHAHRLRVFSAYAYSDRLRLCDRAMLCCFLSGAASGHGPAGVDVRRWHRGSGATFRAVQRHIRLRRCAGGRGGWRGPILTLPAWTPKSSFRRSSSCDRGLGSLRAHSSQLLIASPTPSAGLLPSLALFLIYLAMILVCLVRPQACSASILRCLDSIGRPHHGGADHRPDAPRRT